MAVYTQLNEQDLEQLLTRYEVGTLHSFQAISEGIENTNYFVNTVKGTEQYAWVLTLFENLDKDELPYFSELTAHLAGEGLAVPAPQVTKDDQSIVTIKARQAVLVPRFSGKAKTKPSYDDCAKIGSWLAHMHLALNHFSLKRALVRDESWMQSQIDKLDGYIPAEELVRVTKYVNRYIGYKSALLSCPQGTVHGDLFKDNVLFDQDQISGVIDFYHACNATLLFDLAVVANDWCVTEEGYDTQALDALITAYQKIRPWTDQELACWSNCLELAALRFWLSRLVSKFVPGYQHDSVSGETIKNPDEMKRLLPAL